MYQYPFNVHTRWGNVPARGYSESWAILILYGNWGAAIMKSSNPQLSLSPFFNDCNQSLFSFLHFDLFLLFFKMRVAAALFFKWKTGISKHYSFDGALIIMGPHSGNHVCISFVQLCVRLFLPKMGPFGIRFTWTHRHRLPTDDIYFVVAVKSTDYTQRSSFAICIPAAQSF